MGYNGKTYKDMLEKYNELGFNMVIVNTITKGKSTLYDLSSEYIKGYISKYKIISEKNPGESVILIDFREKIRAKIYIFEDVLNKRRSIKIQRIKDKIK